MSKIIKIYNGNTAVVSDKDYKLLVSCHWFMSGEYAVTCIKQEDGYYKNIKMHQLILTAPEGLVIDHIDGNTLNNERENLRVCTISQNAMNKRKTLNKCTSMYKGVRFNDGRWESYIYLDGKAIHLGSFSTEVSAANIYNHAAREFFREFARLNECEFLSKEDCETFRLNKGNNKYFGVSYNKVNEKWTVKIKGEYLGSFKTELDAVIFYNQHVINRYGKDYKYINKIDAVSSDE